MKVVLDSNVICQDFRMRGTQFRIMFDGLMVIPATLYVPEVVIDEVVNRLREDIAAALVEQSKAVKKLARLLGRKMEPASSEVNAEHESEQYRNELVDTLNSVAAEFLPYPQIPHKKVVERDLRREKPFKRDGSGYRDYLIWQAVRKLVDIGTESVVFVTGNLRDFGDGSRVAPELMADLTIPGNLRIVPSIKEFNDEFVIPRLKMFDEAHELLELTNNNGLNLVKWLQGDLLHLLPEDELGPVVAGWPYGVGNARASRVLKIEKIQVKDVRRLVGGGLFARIHAAAVIVVNLDVGWEEYLEFPEVREWVGATEERFSSSYFDVPVELEMNIDLTFDDETNEINSRQLTAIEGPYYSVNLASS